MELIWITENEFEWFQPLLLEEGETFLHAQDYAMLGAVKEGTACGVIAFSFTFTTVTIEYLAVADDFRRQKVGTFLLNEVVHMALPFQQEVRCYLSIENESDEIYQLFESHPAFVLEAEDSCSYRFACSRLSENAILSSIPGEKWKVTAYDSLPGSERKKFVTMLEEEGIFSFSVSENRIPELCMVNYNKDKICAALFFEKVEDNEIELSFAYCDYASSKALILQFAKARDYLLKNFPKDTIIHVGCINEESANLIGKLLPGMELYSKGYIARWNGKEA